ncbi:MAG: HAD-IIA family hydrolase [Pseudonocardiaceae bacterium]
MRRSGPAVSVADWYDAFLFDLDGVVYRGASAIPHAVESLETAATDEDVFLRHEQCRPHTRRGRRASPIAGRVGDRLGGCDLGRGRGAGAGRRAVRGRSGPRCRGRSLETALYDAGLRPVRSADENPRAVFQGWAPNVDWNQLAEGAYALAGGIPWATTNTDITVPKERRLAPRNGTLVAAVAAATGRQPRVIGKQEPGLFEEAIRRTEARRALVIGDRLDTDIAGAVRGGLDSALVLSGATSAADLLQVPDCQRPTYVWQDLRDMSTPCHACHWSVAQPGQADGAHVHHELDRRVRRPALPCGTAGYAADLHRGLPTGEHTAARKFPTTQRRQ